MTQLDHLRARVRAFLAEELAERRFTPHCDSWLVGNDRAFSRRLGAQHLIGLMLPTEFGGGGGGVADRLVVSEELLAAGAPVAAHWFAERQFAPSLLRHGTSAQQLEWLPRITGGEACIAIGLSEPDAGSDLAAVRTRAVASEGGWRITGTKIWTSGAHLADAMVVLARTGGERHAGLTQFIVRLPNPDVTVRPIRLISGEHHFNEVSFTEAFVPDADVLGEIGNGWTQAMQELAFERAGPERYLSTLPLLQAMVEGLGPQPADPGAVGRIIADISTFRVVNQRVIEHLAAGDTAAIDIAMLKSSATAFEQRSVAVALDLAADPGRVSPPSTEAATLLRESQFQAPGFTIRGGTNEVLRGIVSKGLLR
ncbi:MAG: acyl-CoA dehydrogenase family protein [Candidatus Nanopelagicales bacterium]|nr:acyl-CoA dehydrogenase family protein [Candidatus Nanopelagicales bacterium]